MSDDPWFVVDGALEANRSSIIVSRRSDHVTRPSRGRRPSGPLMSFPVAAQSGDGCRIRPDPGSLRTREIRLAGTGLVAPPCTVGGRRRSDGVQRNAELIDWVIDPETKHCSWIIASRIQNRRRSFVSVMKLDDACLVTSTRDV